MRFFNHGGMEGMGDHGELLLTTEAWTLPTEGSAKVGGTEDHGEKNL